MIRLFRKMVVVAVVAMVASSTIAAKKPAGDYATEKDYQWWRDARFGVFIHWGVGSCIHRNGIQRHEPPAGHLPGHQKGYNARHLPVPKEITNGDYLKWAHKGGKAPCVLYDNLYRVFDPEKFNADEWVKTFKDAGAGYMIFTTKHHDGFCMWNTKTTDYNVMNTPFKRDICKELADACHKYGIKLFWYYSVLDLCDPRYDVAHPEEFEPFLFEQIRELLTNYGRVDGIWWDGGRIKFDRQKLCEMMRKLQPGILYNGRCWGGKYGVAFGSPEQRIGTFSMDRPWETCAVIHAGSWFWNGGKDIKSLNMCLSMLIDSVCGDGNLALDFGPCPDGTIYPTIKERYLGMGKWLKKYGESVYKTRGGPYKPGQWGGATRKGNKVYLHITQEWPGGVLELPALPAKIKKCKSLAGGRPKCKQTDDKVTIKLPAKYHHKPDTVIVLTLDRDAMEIDPIDTMEKGKTLTANAKVTASSSASTRNRRGAAESLVSYSFESGKIAKHFGEESDDDKIAINKAAECPFDKAEKERIRKLVKGCQYGHFWRYWMPKKGDAQPWVMVDMWKPKTFSRVGISDLYGQIKGYKLQYLDGAEWKTFYEGESVDQLRIKLEKPVTAQKVRLLITATDGNLPSISKFDLFK